MNIVLECEVILSKKFEAVCEQGEPVSILITSVSGNKGRAIIRIACKDDTKDVDVAKMGETSIQFKVVSASDDVKSLDGTSRISNMISSNGLGIPASAESLVAKTSPDVSEGEPYAVPKANPTANPLEAITGNPDAIKALTAILAAAGLSLTKQPDGQTTASPTAQVVPQVAPQRQAARDNSIRNYEELLSEIALIPGIDQEIKLPADRKLTRGEADQVLSRLPKLRRKAFIRNTMQSQLLIGDLFTSFDGVGPCLALLPGQAFDLTRIPAKNITSSNDFRWCVETGKIAFVNSADFAASFKRVNEEAARWSGSELKVYGGESSRMSPTDPSGGVAENMAAGEGIADDGTEIRIGPSGSDPILLNVDGQANEAPPSVPYEESPEMQNLISQMPSSRPAPQQRGPRRV